MYKLVNDPINGGLADCIKRNADNALIPMVNGNRDYQEYLEWIAEGNTPEEAE